MKSNKQTRSNDSCKTLKINQQVYAYNMIQKQKTSSGDNDNTENQQTS